MEKNVGGLDRSTRIVLGALLGIAGIVVVLGYWQLGTVVGAVALVVGAVLLATGTTQKCPINSAMDVDTTK